MSALNFELAGSISSITNAKPWKKIAQTLQNKGLLFFLIAMCRQAKTMPVQHHNRKRTAIVGLTVNKYSSILPPKSVAINAHRIHSTVNIKFLILWLF